MWGEECNFVMIQSRGKYAHIDRVISSFISKSMEVRDQAFSVIANRQKKEKTASGSTDWGEACSYVCGHANGGFLSSVWWTDASVTLSSSSTLSFFPCTPAAVLPTTKAVFILLGAAEHFTHEDHISHTHTHNRAADWKTCTLKCTGAALKVRKGKKQTHSPLC